MQLRAHGARLLNAAGQHGVVSQRGVDARGSVDVEFAIPLILQGIVVDRGHV
jgi:hypothetical protein